MRCLRICTMMPCCNMEKHLKMRISISSKEKQERLTTTVYCRQAKETQLVWHSRTDQHYFNSNTF